MEINTQKLGEEKEFFSKISIEERELWLKEMLLKKPNEGKPQKIFVSKHEHPTNEFTFKGVQLNYHKIEQIQKNVSSVLFFFHGLNGHGGNYAYITTNIAKNININIYLLDLKNFGQSQGQCRGLISSFEECMEQAEQFIQFILNRYKQKPRIFIGGNSFGGTISFNLGIKNPQKYSGVIFLAPALRQINTKYFLKLIIKGIGFLFPRLKTINSSYGQGNKYDFSDIFQQDEHNYLGRLMPRTYRTVLNAIDETSQKYSQFNLPYIVFQGGVDKVVDLFAPIDLEKQCKSQDKTTIYFKDMWHCIPFEEQVQHIADLIVKWLQSRT